mgnify:CR=1 FL=1
MDGVIVKVAVIDNLHSRLCLLCRLLIRSNDTRTLLHSPERIGIVGTNNLIISFVHHHFHEGCLGNEDAPSDLDGVDAPLVDQLVHGVLAAMEQTHHVLHLHHVGLLLEIFENVSLDHTHITSCNL